MDGLSRIEFDGNVLGANAQVERELSAAGLLHAVTDLTTQTFAGMTNKYHESVEIIVSGVDSCLKNASDLSKSARILLRKGISGPALSLSVLALEEIGKLMYMDSLLFARTGDLKTERFKKGFLNHKKKLDYLVRFPLLVECLGVLRRSSVKRRWLRSKVKWLWFRYLLESTIDEVEKWDKWLGDAWEFSDLDVWKQRGFYAAPNKQGLLVAPQEAVPRELSTSIVAYTRAIVGILRMLWDGLSESYAEFAHQARRIRTREDDAEIIALAGELLEERLSSNAEDVSTSQGFK